LSDGSTPATFLLNVSLFQDDFANFIFLFLFIGILIFPAKISTAILAKDVANTMTASNEHFVLRWTNIGIDDFIKEISPTQSTLEALADE
jgi:hypothetical protein